MTRSAPLCENASHVGSRLVDRRDLLERRIEWRGVTAQNRAYTRIVRRECSDCVRREILREGNGGSLVATLPGTAL